METKNMSAQIYTETATTVETGAQTNVAADNGALTNSETQETADGEADYPNNTDYDEQIKNTTIAAHQKKIAAETKMVIAGYTSDQIRALNSRSANKYKWPISEIMGDKDLEQRF